MDVNEAKRLKALEDENRRLKTMVADQALDIQVRDTTRGWRPPEALEVAPVQG